MKCVTDKRSQLRESFVLDAEEKKMNALLKLTCISLFTSDQNVSPFTQNILNKYNHALLGILKNKIKT